jgi:metal-responsive CopG/Arc/MetJ family transcriptional regulator
MTESSLTNSRYNHTQVTLRLPAHILRRVDEVAAEQFTNRATILRQILGTWAARVDAHSSCKPSCCDD